MTEEIKAQIKVVVEARQKAAKVAEAKRASLAEWEKQNISLISESEVANANLDDAEEKLRELTIANFNETGNKAPVLGVGIREGVTLVYDAEIALKWAMEHKMSLSLNKGAFERLVRATPGAFGFVKINPKITATIAKELEVVE